MNFLYDHNDYRFFLQDLTIKTGGSFDGTVFTFPSHLAKGFFRIIEMPGGLQALISDYITESDFSYKRIASLPEVFTLRIDYAELGGSSHVLLDDKAFFPHTSIYANMLMTSSRFNYGIILHKGTRVRSVNILLKEEWMRKYFSQYDVSFWLKYLHTLRLNGVNRVPIDFDARKSLFDLLDYPIDDPGYMIFVQTRIFELMDDYANQILRLKNNNQQEEILFIDVAKIIELDVLINSKIEQQAALPSIDEMATIANMSASKLKTLFKKMYNQSISDYFNTCRLSTAKKVLLQQHTSIKELSNQFGYKSVQHFTTAFKKQFGETPATLLKRENA